MSELLFELKPDFLLSKSDIRCTLNKTCYWGGRNDFCCVSCPKINECRVNCREADTWIITGKRCEDANVS